MPAVADQCNLVRKYNEAENTIYKWVAEEHKRRSDQNQLGLSL